MGTILHIHRKTVVTPKAELPVGGAQILLFTGVRYERYEEFPKSEKSTLAPVRSRRRRA